MLLPVVGVSAQPLQISNFLLSWMLKMVSHLILSSYSQIKKSRWAIMWIVQFCNRKERCKLLNMSLLTFPATSLSHWCRMEFHCVTTSRRCIGTIIANLHLSPQLLCFLVIINLNKNQVLCKVECWGWRPTWSHPVTTRKRYLAGQLCGNAG